MACCHMKPMNTNGGHTTMATHKVISMIDGQPTFAEPLQDILAGCKMGWAIKILSPLEYHTDQQRKWYRGPCLHGLSQWNGDTVDEWDMRLKDQCNGVELLKTQTIYLGPGSTCQRLTIQGVGKRNMTAFIEQIISLAIAMEWPVTPPDADLRR